MKVEEYVKMLERIYEDKKVYCLDSQRVLEWEELAEDYMRYAKDEYDIATYVEYLVYDRNSNCKLIKG